MGLAGFNRARLRQGEVGEKSPAKSKYQPQPEHHKNICSICDRVFNNISAYKKHMEFKHRDLSNDG